MVSRRPKAMAAGEERKIKGRLKSRAGKRGKGEKRVADPCVPVGESCVVEGPGTTVNWGLSGFKSFTRTGGAESDRKTHHLLHP